MRKIFRKRNEQLGKKNAHTHVKKDKPTNQQTNKLKGGERGVGRRYGTKNEDGAAQQRR